MIMMLRRRRQNTTPLGVSLLLLIAAVVAGGFSTKEIAYNQEDQLSLSVRLMLAACDPLCFALARRSKHDVYLVYLTRPAFYISIF